MIPTRPNPLSRARRAASLLNPTLAAGALLAAALVLAPAPAVAAPRGGPGATGSVAPRAHPADPERLEGFSSGEVVSQGHQFFGQASKGIALAIEETMRRYGQPNGYILGQELSGAFGVGLRYGEGTLYTRNAGERRIYWQGPSLGLDVGGDGDRTMMLVYDLPRVAALYERYVGGEGSAYLVGGLALTALRRDDVVVVPIRTGVGLRLGLAMSYLKFSPEPTWNPF